MLHFSCWGGAEFRGPILGRLYVFLSPSMWTTFGSLDMKCNGARGQGRQL